MKKISKLFLIFMFVIICFSLTGCGAKNLVDEDKIIADVETTIPNARFVNMENEKTDDQFGKNVYYFTNGDFEFIVENEMERDPIFAINKNKVSNTYFQELIFYYKYEIKDLIKKNGIVFNDFHKEYYYDDNFKKILKENETGVVLKDLSFSGSKEDIFLDFYIGDFNKIDNIFDLFKDVKDLLEDYIPKESEKYSSFNISYNITSIDEYLEGNYYDNYYYKESKGFINENFDIELARNVTKHEYAYFVRTNRVADIGLKYSDSFKYKPVVIDKLVVENEEIYNDEKKGYKFIYNVEDDKYYIALSYGNEFKDNGGVTDGVQRDIIEKFYSNTNYEINNTKNISTYSINGNKYKIKYSNSTKYFDFYKNDEKLNIKMLEYVGFRSTGATYRKFISVDDFAELMEMNVSNINYDEGIIYLEKK